MYKVLFVGKIEDQIDDFISAIYQNNLKLYSDCGIDNIHFIKKNYLEHAEMMRKSIIEQIIKSGESYIIGKMQSETGSMFSVQIASFRMFIYYSEDESLKNRFLESIEFYRK